MLQRAISGFFFVVVMVLSIWYSSWTMALLFTGICIVALIEFHRLRVVIQPDASKSTIIISGLFAFVITILRAPQPIISLSNSETLLGINTFVNSVLLANILSGGLILFLVIRDLFETKSSYPHTATGLFAAFYIGVPFGLLFYFIINPQSADLYSGMPLLYFFILLWTNDTFAYLSGKFLGKTKLWERISPNKTWEGFVGGALFTMIAFFIIGNQDSDLGFIKNQYWIPLVVSVFATLGDLSESLLKRQAGVKDSGNIMPGHGGVLDRFDGILLSMPALVFCFSLYLIISQ
ncbi:MAG: phosphatidate cytidylyltransferase [Flavobacteriales bacterium]|nr:phosphatidate cytidylyltransferase [Flavobacteriales bacterium]